MTIPIVSTIDFETEGIGSRPEQYPPIPVGVAIQLPGERKGKYYAWGHPSENNCTKRQAIQNIRYAMDVAPPVYHNGPFDIEVGYEHLGLPIPTVWHDTKLLLYLYDPRLRSFSLKPASEEVLGIAPEERDELRDWILANVPEAKKSDWGAYICRAPAGLAGKYAVGDTTRTKKLFNFLYPVVCPSSNRHESMEAAYEREKRECYVALDMERHGVPVSVSGLQRGRRAFQKAHDVMEQRIFKALKCEPFNVGSSKQLGPRLKSAGMVDEFILTKKGNPSMSRANLEAVIHDQEFLKVLQMYSIVSHHLSTFFNPWLDKQVDGMLHPTFNTTRGTDDERGNGTKTGRLSSAHPNFQGITGNVKGNKNEELYRVVQEYLWRECRYKWHGMRQYIVAPKGYVLLNRDYSQQELRILAHFEDGELLRQYQHNPKMDIHQVVTDMITKAMRKEYPRKFIKIVVFAILYGRGIKALAEQLGVDEPEAKNIKAAVLDVLPGVKHLNKELRKMARDEVPLRTWGGRYYYCEEPRIIQGRMRTFEYKMLNLLIQGSAADCTKEAQINVADNCDHAEQIIQVHDEIMMLCPSDVWQSEMRKMREAMEAVQFDVPMLTDGKMGRTNWAQMKEAA